MSSNSEVSVSDDEIVLERHGEHIAIVRLNRPARGNSLVRSMREPLRQMWRDLDADPSVRVVVVTGTGPRHFCTGVDVNAVAATGETTSGDGPAHHEIVWSPLLSGVGKPVICAVNGLVAGGGLHFVVDADIVVAGEHVEFLDTHTGIGMVGAVENTGLARRLPLGTALRMTLEGKSYRLGAPRAYQLGLVDELCAPGEELEHALAIAENVARNSPRANRLSKQAVWASIGVPHEQSAEYAWALARLHWNHPDFKEGPRAFAEKRDPEWQAG
jgi:E-phenylitaconyl-CoA hydratase